MPVVIDVAKLGKRYQIGRGRPSHDLREILTRGTARLAQRLRGRGATSAPGREIWAVRGVSFQVRAGEVIGLIGRNGAGKSTLLKMLCRITEPTEGRIGIRGRVGSLLEVGTGFHPELTGRENIYLNGAILGMRGAEIERKFDDVVSFAEVETFIDTPVKHYSSGMYARLAFAVAAHLDPDLLIVDEVLAVGDASFQRRCLGKMSDASRQGRTVIFVSHNLTAISSLCQRALLLEKGELAMDGPVAAVVSRYQSEARTERAGGSLDHVERYGSGRARFRSLELAYQDAGGEAAETLLSGGTLVARLCLQAEQRVADLTVGLVIYDGMGYRLIDANTTMVNEHVDLDPGQEARIELRLDNVLLRPATYVIGLWAGRIGSEDVDVIPHAQAIAVELGGDAPLSPVDFPGVYRCRFSQRVEILG